MSLWRWCGCFAVSGVIAAGMDSYLALLYLAIACFIAFGAMGADSE